MSAAPIDARSLAALAEQLAGLELPEKDRAAVAAMLESLSGDMQAMRRMDVGVAEPATTYDAGGR